MNISKIALHGASLLALATPLSAMAQTNPQPSDKPAPEAPEARDNAAGGQVPSTAETSIGLDSDIVVTARRREESVQDVPSVINVVTADDIAKLNFRQFNEVQNLVPGLQLESNSIGVGGSARLRGVNFDLGASGNNPTVEFYLNDAPITAGVILQQMYDVGQIEVLRGPQGTLRGRASPSGSITITTRKPDLTSIGGFAEITGNDIGTVNGQAALNIPVIRDIAAIRVAGLFDENEFDRVKPVNRDFGGQDPLSRTRSGRVSALVEPTDWLRFEGVYQHINRYLRSYDQVESFSKVAPVPPPADPIDNDDRQSNLVRPSTRAKQIFNIYNWRAEAAFAGQRLIYQGQHYTQKIDSLVNQDPANRFPATDISQLSRSRTKSTSHEIRLQNEERVFDTFDYVVGLFDNKNDTPTFVTRPAAILNPLPVPIAAGGGVLNPGLNLAQVAIDRLGDSHEQSYFGNLTAHIGDALEISGGLRYIRYKDTSALVIAAQGVNAVRDRKESKLIYSGSVKYNVTPDILIYASTGSSFRPGISIVGDFSLNQSPLEQSFQNLEAETSKSYEIGFKSTLFEDRVRFNVTAFHQKFKNFPNRIPGSGVFFVNFPTSPTVPQVGQFNFAGAVPVEVNGVEGEVSYNISDRWNVGIVAAYSLGRIKNGTIPCTDIVNNQTGAVGSDGQPDVITGTPSLAALQNATGGPRQVNGTGSNISACQVSQRSAFLPPFSATIQSEYSLPLSDRFDAFIRGLFTFNGKSQVNPNSAFDDARRYGLLNVFAGLRDPDSRWEVTGFAKNVFNVNRVLTRNDTQFTSFRTLGTATTATTAYTPITTTPPREFGLSLRYRFGSR